MRLYLKGGLAALVAGSTLLGTGAAVASPAAAPATAAGAGVITVTTPASGNFTLSDDEHRAGPVRFHFVSHRPLDTHGNGGSDMALVQPLHGFTVKQVEDHIAAQQSQNGAASTRWLVANTRFFGGAAIGGLGTADTTQFLPADTALFFIDVNSVFAGHPVDHTFRSVGTPAQRLLPKIAGTIDTTSQDTFNVTSTRLPQGNYLVRNPSDTIHFVFFAPVKNSTTDATITNLIKSGKPPTGSNDPYDHSKTSVESDVLTPSQQQVFSSPKLSPGKYDLECYIADDQTGMPHFFMGMHKIITIS